MHRLTRLLTLTLTLTLILTSPLAALPAPPTDSELAAKIDAIAATQLTKPNAVGLSIAVGRGDSVIFSKGYGSANLEFDIPMNADTILRIGSVTKQFTAAAVMKLVEQNKLSLDDTLDKMLPDYPAPSKPVTLRHLLNHTSGIWSCTDSEEFMERDATLELTPDQVIATFKDKPLEFDPGTKWNYSNSGYYLLGEIIEHASGKPYAQFVQDELFTPLSLTHTRYENNQEIIPNRAQGYGFNGKTRVNDKPIGADVPGAAGSLLSTGSDLARWNIALVNGKVISADSYALMTTPTILPDGSNTKYGFGLVMDNWESRPRISHGGGIFGFTSQLAYFPNEQITVAVIANTEAFDPGKVAASVARAALGLEEFQPKDLAVSKEEFARYNGTYKFTDIPMELRIFEKEEKLWAQGTGQPENRLLAQGNGEFRTSFDHNIRIIFPAGEGPAPEFILHQNGEHKALRKQ